VDKIITGATLLTGEDFNELKDYSLWIKNGKIYRIIPDEKIPENIEVVNKNGCYLFPGLIDLHVHIMWDGSSDPVETHEKEGYEQLLIRSVANCQSYLQAGVTTIRDLGSIDDVALHVAESLNRKLVPGPRLIASGKTITMTGGHDPFWASFADGPVEALKRTREQIYKNAKVIKLSATGGVYGRVEGEVAENAELNYEEIKSICDEAHRFGLKVASHAIGREGIKNSILAGVDTIEHGHYIDEEIMKLMLERQVAWVPTLYIYQQIANLDGVPSYAQEKSRRITEYHVSAFNEFYRSGLLIGAGSDAGACYTPHPSIIEELQTMNSFIGDKIGILKTATSNAGKILGIKTGQITEGYEADFLLMEENPIYNFDALRNIEEVYLQGEQVK